MTVIKNNTVVIKGTRNKNDDLWDIPIKKLKIYLEGTILPSPHPGLYYDETIAHSSSKNKKITSKNLTSTSKYKTTTSQQNFFLKNQKS